MKIRVLCVGKVKEEFFQKQLQEYVVRIRRHCDFEIVEVEDEKTEEQLSESERKRILSTEGQRLLKYLEHRQDELVVALCIEGKQYSTENWKRKLAMVTEQRELHQITYIIGGSLGLDTQVVSRADLKLSFSKLTFPHQLMRVLLAEQIRQTVS